MAKPKLVLGTVQLGMKYGLNNVHGQPPTEEAFAILDAALAGGIDTFDTAYAYGTAEDVLGEWIAGRGLGGTVSVISKMKPHVVNEYPDGTPAADIVQKEIEKSLQRLHVEVLDGYLFHSPYYIYLEHMVAGLRKAKESGVVKNIGVSIYDEAEALQAVELGIDYVQVPYNVFDRRLDRTDFFDLARKNNVTVFARSPFLQGLLLMKPEQIPPHLSYARPYLEKFVEITDRYQVSAAEASLLFAAAHSRADHIVLGAETLSQLSEDLAIVEKDAPEAAWMKEMEESFRDINRGVISPSLWSRIKR